MPTPSHSTQATPEARIAALTDLVATLQTEIEDHARAAEDERRRAERLQTELNVIFQSRLWRVAEGLRSMKPRRRR